MSSNRARQINQVIDLSSTVDSPPTGVSDNRRSLFSGVKLKDLRVGDRLGASRDGGEGFQGCNSRVFRVTVRHLRRDGGAVNLNGACQASGALPQTPTAGVGRGIGRSGSMETPPPPRPDWGGLVNELVGLGEQFIQGSFGACFGGNGPSSSRDPAEDVEICRRDTEFALKMALTYRGQDPAQAEREMATEIAVLVGGRIPPHANIMRGVHSFQDHVGPDLQRVLWAGLGPEAGETLSPRTSFLVMPLYTAGSLEQALLNKRRLRCQGPPFLRLLDTLRFLKQMLSAVQHLLAHGLAHNDIKPANWLLAADLHSLVLTDFGACVDSLRPHSKPPSEHSSTPELMRFSPNTATTEGEAVAGPGVNGGSPSVFGSAACAGRIVHSADGHALPPIGSPVGASGVVVETSGGAGTKRPRDALEDAPAASSSSTAVGSLPHGSRRVAASGPPVISGNVPSPSLLPVGSGDHVAVAVRDGGKRRRCSGGTGSGHPSDYVTGPPSEGLVFPFSEYFVAGTPSIVAPELALAWRERTELDFRRSDIFSVGVCMYHMLRPGGADFDAGPRSLGKGPSRYVQERRGAEAWPLTLFPEDKGGCPFEVTR
ncbi:unnamed protein product, partial [Laminaria digitata]